MVYVPLFQACVLNFNEDFMDCLKYKTSSELKTYLSNFKQSFQEQVIPIW